MKKYKYEILGLAILIVGGIYLFKKIKEVKDLSKTTTFTPEVEDKKASDIDIIINANKFAGARSVLQSFNADFISAWADSVLNKKSTFTYNKKQYNSNGGKAIKK